MLHGLNRIRHRLLNLTRGTLPANRQGLLEGSWVAMSRIKSTKKNVILPMITIATLLVSRLLTTHEPPRSFTLPTGRLARCS